MDDAYTKLFYKAWMDSKKNINMQPSMRPYPSDDSVANNHVLPARNEDLKHLEEEEQLLYDKLTHP
jgi:hypothetical protein